MRDICEMNILSRVIKRRIKPTQYAVCGMYDLGEAHVSDSSFFPSAAAEAVAENNHLLCYLCLQSLLLLLPQSGVERSLLKTLL